MNIIEDADGHWYEVVEGSLEQGEAYVLRHEDLSAEIEAHRKQGRNDGDALIAALADAGRKSVFVRRIPHLPDDPPSDGVSRVYLWNVNGRGDPQPGFLMRALERPSATFYERQRAAAESALAAAQAALPDVEARLATVEDTLAKAGTLGEYRAAIDAGALDERAALTAAKEQIDAAIAQAPVAAAAAEAKIAALAALGPTETGHSVEAIDAQVAMMPPVKVIP